LRGARLNANSPFGLLAFLSWNHDWNNFYFNEPTLIKAAAQLRDLGVGFVRMDILWSDIDRGVRRYDLSRYDRIIEILREHEVQVLGLLHYNKIYEENGREVWNRPPDSNEEFADYAAAVADRYKSWIKHWEIWNEPNHPVYWDAPKDGLKRYATLLSASYAALKKVDPSCTVLNGGLTGSIVEDVGHLYQSAGKDCFDVLNIHPFINPLREDAAAHFDSIVSGVQEVMKKNGDSAKKIWITEMGCPGVPVGENATTWFEGKALNEEQQAAWLETIYRLVRKHPSVEKLFWAFYRDTDEIFKDATDFLGIVRKDLSPKPAFETMKRLISEFSSANPPTASRGGEPTPTNAPPTRKNPDRSR
jgi:hypothetical protein